MSSTLTVYAIAFERLKRVPGSRDRGLVEAIGAEFRGFLARRELCLGIAHRGPAGRGERRPALFALTPGPAAGRYQKCIL